MLEVPSTSENVVLQDRFNQRVAEEHNKLITALNTALQEADYASFKATLLAELLK